MKLLCALLLLTVMLFLGGCASDMPADEHAFFYEGWLHPNQHSMPDS